MLAFNPTQIRGYSTMAAPMVQAMAYEAPMAFAAQLAEDAAAKAHCNLSTRSAAKESAPSARNRPGEQMSLFDGSTYERPDAEVLPLITPESARARGGWGEATPLHEAAWNSSSVAVVQKLLAAYPEAASATNKNGYTPLHVAVRRNRSLAVVQALLAANPEAAMAKDRGGWLPLHYAARYRQSVAVAQALLAANFLAANPEAALVTDGRGDTPADLPSKSNIESKVKALIFASGQRLKAAKAAADKAAAAKAQQEAEDAQLAAAFAASLAVSVPVPSPPPPA
jgi:hypothetical protein